MTDTQGFVVGGIKLKPKGKTTEVYYSLSILEFYITLELQSPSNIWGLYFYKGRLITHISSTPPDMPFIENHGRVQ